MRDNKYEIKCEVQQGLLLPTSTRYRVEVQIGDVILLTDNPIYMADRYNLWNHRFTEAEYNVPYRSIEEFPDVFIYLVKDKTRISYWRGSALEFTEVNAPLRWLTLQVDQSMGELDDQNNAGLISLRLCINDIAKNSDIDFDYVNAFAEELPSEPNFCVV